MASPEKSTTEKRKSPSQTRSRRRVELILDSARELLRDDGLSGFTTTAIADRAGIPVSSLYQYYPNKKAILVAIYDDYLASVRSVFGEFDAPKYQSMDHKAFFSKLFSTISRAELRDQIEDALDQAITLHPELAELDRQHREQTADILAALFRRRGSTWSMPKLRRLAQFLYCINAGIWAYRSSVHPPKKELLEWELNITQTALSSCFD